MEAEDWVSSWRFTLGSDRGTTGVMLRKGLFLQVLLAASLTAHALIANKQTSSFKEGIHQLVSKAAISLLPFCLMEPIVIFCFPKMENFTGDQNQH